MVPRFKKKVSRDKDVRIAIQETLEATEQFEGVFHSGLPEDWGFGAHVQRAAVIEPESSRQEDKWDAQPLGDLIVTSRVVITFISRHEDPQVRNDTAELLHEVAANALNGESLAGLTIPGQTKFVSLRWEKAKPPERRITSIFCYQYIVEGWNALGTEE